MQVLDNDDFMQVKGRQRSNVVNNDLWLPTFYYDDDLYRGQRSSEGEM